MYVFSSSEAISKMYEGVFRLSPKRIVCMGQARNDYFFTPHDNNIRNLYPGRKIVVYMPTHRNEGRSTMDFHNLLDLDRINRLCAEYNFVFLAKKHYFHNGDPIIENNEYSNIFELTHYNIKSQELIDSCDILITDYSSTYIDYLLLNRPILFYAYDLQNYLETDRDMYLEYNQDNIPGVICTTKESLVDEIESLFNGRDDSEAVRAKIKNYYYSEENQGLVAPKQIDKILTLC